MKYFLHDTSAFDDEKITELFIEFGYEGLGLFYTILEKIARQEKPVKTKVLKTQLKVGKRLEKCWKFMEEIGLLSSKNGETFNEQLLNFSEKYQIKKEKNRKRISEWRENKADTKNVTCYESVSNTSKVKESKVKESKYKYIDEILNEFVKAYNDAFGMDYQILNRGKERAAIGKILTLYKNKYPDSTSDETRIGLRSYFDAVVRVPDGWLHDNISPSIIVSKFNEINKIIKNGKNRTNNKGTTDRELAELVNKHFGEGSGQ